MKVSRAVSLGLLGLFVLVLAWSLGVPYRSQPPTRFDGLTLLLTLLYVAVMFSVNGLARDCERPLVSLLIILNLGWIVIPVVAFLASERPLRFDRVHYGGVAEVNLTLLFLILALVISAFGMRIGSLRWLPGGGRNGVTDDVAAARPPLSMHRLLAFGYVVAGNHAIFLYWYRPFLGIISERESGIPYWSYVLNTLLNHDIILLWILAYAVSYWSALSRRQRLNVYGLLSVVIAVYLSKNFLFQLTLLYLYALLSRRGETVVSKKATAAVAVSAAIFVPVYLVGFEIARVELAGEVAGKRLGVVSVVEGLELLPELVTTLADPRENSAAQALIAFGARFDDLVVMLNAEPRGDYLSVWYALKRSVNVVVPRLRPFADSILPQSLLFKVAYGIASWEGAATVYHSDALPAVGVYYVYFGELGALAALFLSCVGFSWLYRKAGAAEGMLAPVFRVYCLYFFSQFLFGMGVDEVVPAFVYNGLGTGALILVFLKVPGVIRSGRPAVLAKAV